MRTPGKATMMPCSSGARDRKWPRRPRKAPTPVLETGHRVVGRARRPWGSKRPPADRRPRRKRRPSPPGEL